MAWIKAFGAPSSAKEYLYNNGVFSVSFDNPGSYTMGSQTIIAWTILGDRLQGYNTTASSQQIIGTTSVIDASQYNSIRIKAKVTQGALRIFVGNTKNYNNLIKYVDCNDIGVTKDYTLDISDQTGNIYVAFLSSPSVKSDIYEIWLE